MATSDKNVIDYSQIASLAGDDELFVFDKSEYAVEGYEGNWTTPTQLTAWSFANSSTYEPKFKGIELEGTTLSSIQSIGKDLWIEIPVILGFNDSEENFQDIADFLFP